MSIPFRPIQGTERTIQQQSIEDGHIYFATDSGKIFLDKNGTRISMGGAGAAILYAYASTVGENFDGTFSIKFSDLEQNSPNPKINDLIINSDGRFFKVDFLDELNEKINCTLIAVSGTGGGGGTEPGTPAAITLEALTTVPLRFIYGQSYNISFRATAKKDALVTIAYHIIGPTQEHKDYYFDVPSGEVHTFDVGKELFLGGNQIKVEASGANSGIASPLSYPSCYAIRMALLESSNFNPLVPISWKNQGNLNFVCQPVGEGLSKTLKIYIDDVLDPSLTRTITTSGQDCTVSIPMQSHGAHTIKAVLSTGSGTTEVSTDPLEYEVAFVDDRDDSEVKDIPIIWTSKVPKSIVDHDKLNIYYAVYNNLNQTQIEVHLYVNQDELLTSPIIVANSKSSWLLWNVNNYKVGSNTLTIQCGQTAKTMIVEVEKDELRDLDILTAGLYLNLNSNGRSNKENPTSRETWEYTNMNGLTTKAVFENFNWYNNGWIVDASTGTSYLRVSNGAKLKIPLQVLDYVDLLNPLTFEMRFRIRNIQSYKNLITFEPDIDSEGEVIGIKKTISSTESVFASYYNNAIGFNLGTQEGFFKTKDSAIVSGRYKEDAIVTVSFVAEAKSDKNLYPLIYMYINGEMVSIVNYKASDSFAASATELIVNSDFCDVDIYDIRVYTIGLSQTDIVHNYVADQADALLYDMNQIVTFENNVPSLSYSDLIEYNTKHPDNLSIPYCVVETVDTQDERLPYVKGGKMNLNVTFVNPALDKAYTDKEEGMTGKKYIQGCPSFIAKNIEFDVQGTSSQGYPRRNYKGKFKYKEGANSWVYTNGPLKGLEIGKKNEYDGAEYKGYYMDNDHSETTFTWKADYMESSMTHNTGFTSFVKTLYDKHPLQDYISGFQPGDMRTTIYGFPMILFQKFADGHYEFIGRYNFNLDKSANNVIGFGYEEQHPVLTDKKIPEVAECWEFKNNQGTRCSFKVTDFAQTKPTNDGSIGTLTVLDDFEYRYSAYEDDIDAAIDGTDDFASKTQEERNAFIVEKMKNLEDVCNWLKSTHTELVTNEPLPEPVVYNNITYDIDNRDYRLAKFRNEFDQHFDREYCEVYFICTELLIQYDSRGKNMMFATWGPQKEGGNYIWYPIFYDVDTQLGISNSGVPSWDYDTEATATNTFSTSDSALHNNLWACFADSIKARYKNLRAKRLTYEKLNGYYSYDPAISGSYAMHGVKPISIINIDQYWKYIAPTFTGYIDTSGNLVYDQGKRFYCLQGSRTLQRELFLRNRFNFIDSSWLGGSYAPEGAKSEVQIRYTANDPVETSDKYLDREPTAEEAAKGFEYAPWPMPLDADLTWKITPFLKQYVSAIYDDAPTVPIPSDIKETTIDMPGPDGTLANPTVAYNVKNSPTKAEQLVYFGGAEYISSLGDISLKYPNEMSLTKLKRVKELLIGNDAEGYFNRALDDNRFSLGAEAYNADGTPNESAKTLLEKVVLTGLGSLTKTVDVSGSEKLKEFRALKSSIAGVNLAEGTQIETLHLPKTTTSLALIEPTVLSNILTEVTKDDEGNYSKGLYIEGVTDLNSVAADSTTKIDSFKIVGGNMGYDSYKLLKKLVDIKVAMQNNVELNTNEYSGNLSINAESVHWSPYRQIISGEAYDSTKSYVQLLDNYTFANYTYDTSTWAQDTLNGKVYMIDQDDLTDINEITSLELLDTFIESYESGNNYFRDPARPLNELSVPYLTGDIFVNNPASNPIKEIDIANKYKQIKYFPDLNIYVKNVSEGYTAKYVEIKENGQEVVLDLLKYDPETTTSPTMSTVTPTRLHHDFYGWSLEPYGEILSKEAFTELQFSESKKQYVFYAVFNITSYLAIYKDEASGYEEGINVSYGDNFVLPSLIPYRGTEEDALEIDQRFGFKGWTTDSSRAGIVTTEVLSQILVDPTTYLAERNYTFYAVFVQENVYKVATDSKYFNFTPIDDDIRGTGYQISLNGQYTLTGKVTIPATYANTPIVSVGSFASSAGERIKYVFFEEGSKCQNVDTSAFECPANNIAPILKGVYLPETITYIGDKAFYGQVNMTDIILNDNITYIGADAFRALGGDASFKIDKLPANLLTLGENAFRRGGPNIRITSLPSKLEKIPNSCFRYCNNVVITEFGGLNGEGMPSLVIGESAFEQFDNATGDDDTISRIYIYDTVTGIGLNAFKNYGAPTGVTAYTTHQEGTKDWNYANLGLAGIEWGYTYS